MNLENAFLFGVDVLKTVVKGAANTILAQVGDAVQEVTEGDLAEWWQHVGFVSRPPRPEAGKRAAQVLGIRRRDRDVLFASRDLRGQELAGNLDDGETCVYAPGPDGTAQGRILIKKDGSINVYTRAGNTSGGNGMAIMLTPSDDSFSLTTGAGIAIVATAAGLKLTAGESSLSLNADGTIKLIGKGQVQMDGSTVVLGSVAVPVTNSAIRGPTGVSGAPSPKVIIE